jgi:hypothetical protein
MDGEISEQMVKSGADYLCNYGVSVVHLRKMALEVGVNHQLAVRLWYREIRETMIIATLIADPKQFGYEELKRWGEMIKTIELAEQVGRNLLVHNEVDEILLTRWINGDFYFQQYAAVMAVGWRYRFYAGFEYNQFEEVLPQIIMLSGDAAFMRVSSFFMRMVVRFSKKYRPVVVNLISEWKMDDNAYKKAIAEEIEFEIE